METFGSIPQPNPNLISQLESAQYVLNCDALVLEPSHTKLSDAAQKCLNQLQSFDPKIHTEKYPSSTNSWVIVNENKRVLKDIGKLYESCMLLAKDDSLNSLSQNQFLKLGKALKEHQNKLQDDFNQANINLVVNASSKGTAADTEIRQIHRMLDRMDSNTASKAVYQFGNPPRTEGQLYHLKNEMVSKKDPRLPVDVPLPQGNENSDYLARSLIINKQLKQIIGWKYNQENAKQTNGLVGEQWLYEREETKKALFDTYALIDSFGKYLQKNPDLDSNSYQREANTLLKAVMEVTTHHFSDAEKKWVQDDLSKIFKELKDFDNHFKSG